MHLFQDWGVEITATSLPEDSPPEWEILIRSESELNSDLGEDWKRLQTLLKVKPEAQLIMEIRGNRLFILLSDVEAFPSLINGLKHPVLLDLCEMPYCWIGKTLPPKSTSQKKQSTPPKIQPRMSFKDLGYEQGWTAQGLGEHQFNTRIEIPPDWELVSYLTWELDVRVPEFPEYLDPSRTLMIFEINGQPWQSFHIKDMASPLAHLKLKVPERYWEEDQLELSLSVQFKLLEEAPCAAFDDELTWMLIEPQSGLSLPRKVKQYDGIKNWFEGLTFLPDLVWNDGFTFEALELFATHTQELKNRFPDQTWAWIPENQPCPGPCLHVLPMNPTVIGLKDLPFYFSERQKPFVDSLKTVEMPLLNFQNIFLVHQWEQEVLILMPSAGISGSPIPRLDWPAFNGSTALWHQEKWYNIGQRPLGTLELLLPAKPKEEAPPPDNVQSVEETQVIWVNWVWGGVSLLVLLGLLYWIWKSRQRRDAPVEVGTDD